MVEVKNTITLDNEDYYKALSDIGVSHDVAFSQSINESDYKEIDLTKFGLVVSQSPIHGNGLFTLNDISAGSFICFARVNGVRSQAGRFSNHSANPNCEMRASGDDIALFSTRDIGNGDELTIDYRQSTHVNIEILNNKTYDDKVDSIERELLKFPALEVPTVHRFTPGMYIREAFAPAGAILTSKIHLTEHPFCMLKGEQSILENDGTWTRLKAPLWGVTKIGSRRVCLIHEDTVMISFHATNETDIDKLEDELYTMRVDHLGLDDTSLSNRKSIQRGANSFLIKG